MIFFSFRKSVFGLASLLFLVWSCDSILNTDDYEFDDLELSPTMVAPLAFGDMNIRDLLKSADSAYIKVYPDGLVYIEYDQLLRSSALRELITIPDKGNVSATLAAPGSLPPVASDYTSSEVENYEYFNFNPEEVNEVLFKGGKVLYDVSLTPSNPDFKYAVIVSIPEFTHNQTNEVFSREIAGVGEIDLTGYRYESTVANRITIKYTLVVKQNASPTTISPGTVVNVELAFRGMDYTYVKGYFGLDRDIDLPAERLDVSAFGTALLDDAEVSFVQPIVEFIVTNEMGVSTNVYFDVLEARKPGSVLPLQINPVSPVLIASPPSLGESASTTITATNASALIDFAPTHFYYKAHAIANDGIVSGVNFIADTSELKVRMHVEVPLYGKASRIVLSDTVEIDLSDVDESNIESAALKVKVNNEMPLQARIQFLLADENFNVFDSLLAPDKTLLIKSSEVNNSGELQTPGVVDELIPIEPNKINKIFQARNIIIRARVSTAPGSANTFPDVKFKADYRMKVNLGLQAKLKITAEL